MTSSITTWWFNDIESEGHEFGFEDDSEGLFADASNLDVHADNQGSKKTHCYQMSKFRKPAILEWKFGIQFRRSKKRVSVPWVSGAKCVDTRAQADVQVAAKQRMLTTKRHHVHQEVRRFQISMGWSMTKQSYLKRTSAAHKWARYS